MVQSGIIATWCSEPCISKAESKVGHAGCLIYYRRKYYKSRKVLRTFQRHPEFFAKIGNRSYLKDEVERAHYQQGEGSREQLADASVLHLVSIKKDIRCRKARRIWTLKFWIYLPIWLTSSVPSSRPCCSGTLGGRFLVRPRLKRIPYFPAGESSSHFHARQLWCLSWLELSSCARSTTVDSSAPCALPASSGTSRH